MFFANPIFLFALAGAAAPVVIHLLTRDRVQHVAFSTLRFFAKGAKLVVRRKKFQELLLLLMRVSLLALLAITFARPFFNNGAVISGRQFTTARVLVLDVSGSMRRRGLPEALKKEALAAADSLRDGKDTGAVITFADAPSVQLPFGEKMAAVRTAAEAVTPGYGGTNIADALHRADELLRGVHATQKEIVLVSDLQRAGWNYFKGDWKLGSDVKLFIDMVKPSGGENGIGIVEMNAPSSLVLDKEPSSIAVRIANYSAEPRNGLQVALLLNGKKVDTQQVNMRANGNVAVRFRHVFDQPGDNPGSIVVGSDAEPANNQTVYFNARTLPRIPVLLIDGGSSTNSQPDAAFFIARALVPTDASPFTVSTLPADKVSVKDISAANVVILANVGELPAAVADALSGLLDRGGGVFFLPGDQVVPERFDAEFGKIAPCKLRQVLQARGSDGETAASLTRIDYEHPIFDVFSAPHHGDLSLPKFARYWETTDTQLSHVLARFGDDRPAMLERKIGRGDSIIFVSAVDGSWNDFAKQSVFLPFIHQTVRYLAVQTGRQTTYNCGDILPLPEGDAVKDPQGQILPGSLVGSGKSGVLAAQPGIYYALNKSGQPEFCDAVNASLKETDPATIAADEITAAIQRAPGEIFTNPTAEVTATGAVGKKDTGLWWYLVCGIIALSVAELAVANKTLRH